MIPGTVGARHPRPKPNEKICCTFDGHRPTVGHRGLEHDRTKFLFLKMGDDLRLSLTMTYGRSLTIGGGLRFSARFWARVARPYGIWIIH